MKIVEIESFEIHPPLQAWNEDAHRLYQGGTWDARTLVVLRADNGLEGLGEYEGPPNERMQGELEKLRGTNPCQWLAHPRLNIWLAPAIYDLVAQAEGVPVYQLFGPKVRSWVPVSSWTVSQTPARMAEEVQRAVAAGHTWLKYHTHHFHNAIDQTRAMQEVAPRGFKIHYDVNFDNTVDQVVELARELAQFPVAGLIEDPLRTFDLEGHVLLRRKCALPIVFHHLPLGGREALMGLADGYMLGHSPVGETIKRAGLFEAANVPFMLQNVGGNITLAFVAHMAAAFDRATLHHVTATNLWAEDAVRPAFSVVSGQVRVPEEPGLGVKLDRQALERLRARPLPPLPRALVRIIHRSGATCYARPPLIRNPLLDEREVPGYGEGYNLPLDQDYWYEDGSERFARLWERAGKGLVVGGE
jgi:L-alanine-DL-glutamate epimerase-like enolase superfamily enzyme